MRSAWPHSYSVVLLREDGSVAGTLTRVQSAERELDYHPADVKEALRREEAEWRRTQWASNYYGSAARLQVQRGSPTY